ncbi:hypothetical protein NM688_g1113 [Phlebia brevispora]|uniref:Uncharacterized protein n=1 Tax=Phlebia brevispora TaxID=194682 RepID=A0ACC1TC45_9APHY|nr:hypothetical protein NM688_g1113 [Phlebia brevispora]
MSTAVQAGVIEEKKARSQKRELRRLQEVHTRHKQNYTVNDWRRQKVRSQNEELAKLRAVIQMLTKSEEDVHMEENEKDTEINDVEGDPEGEREGEEEANDEDGDDESDGGLSGLDSESGSIASAVKGEYPSPIIDDEGIPRCKFCAWEVVDGLCQGCWEKYESHFHRLQRHSTRPPTLPPRFHPATRARGSPVHSNTDSVGICPPYGRIQAASDARGDPPDVRDLRSRVHGCTRHRGTADEDVFEEFSSLVMKVGDRWKLYLGRAVVLDTADPDGSQFIAEFLEEATLFAPPSTYKTVIESPGVWATLPVDANGDGLPDEDEVFDNWDCRDLALKEEQQLEREVTGAPVEPEPVQNIYERSGIDDTELDAWMEESTSEEDSNDDSDDNTEEEDKSEDDGSDDDCSNEQTVAIQPGRPDGEYIPRCYRDCDSEDAELEVGGEGLPAQE